MRSVRRTEQYFHSQFESLQYHRFAYLIARNVSRLSPGGAQRQKSTAGNSGYITAFMRLALIYYILHQSPHRSLSKYPANQSAKRLHKMCLIHLKLSSHFTGRYMLELITSTVWELRKRDFLIKFQPVMLYIILDAVVDIWNKTYIKLPTSQLEILRDNKAILACYVVKLNWQSNVEQLDVKALQYVLTKKGWINFSRNSPCKSSRQNCNSPNQLSLFARKMQHQNNATEGAIQGYPVRVETIKIKKK